MSERPTEALRAQMAEVCRTAIGAAHPLASEQMKKDAGKCAKGFVCQADALDATITALTAEVGRLREALAKSESAPKVSTTPIEEEAFPFPPADQPAPATRQCPSCKGVGEAFWCPDQAGLGGTFGRCEPCNGTGRVPATEDENPCIFPRCDCTSAVCPKEDKQ